MQLISSLVPCIVPYLSPCFPVSSLPGSDGKQGFKEQREQQRKEREAAGDTRAWSALYMRPDTVRREGWEGGQGGREGGRVCMRPDMVRERERKRRWN